jgi:hypothetical protein
MLWFVSYRVKPQSSLRINWLEDVPEVLYAMFYGRLCT